MIDLHFSHETDRLFNGLFLYIDVNRERTKENTRGMSIINVDIMF